jgi:hypothetical protein
MAIDFELTDAQKKLQQSARAFAKDCLEPVVRQADLEADPQKAFEMMRGPCREAHKLGFAMGFLLKAAAVSATPTCNWLPRISPPLTRGLPPSFWSTDLD